MSVGSSPTGCGSGFGWSGKTSSHDGKHPKAALVDLMPLHTEDSIVAPGVWSTAEVGLRSPLGGLLPSRA